MSLWRCLNCKAEFQADKPVCAACELDPTTDPRAADLFRAIEVIHFDPPTRVPGVGRNHAACDPKVRYGANRMFTGEPGSVTCPACKASPAFAAAGGKSNGVRDLPLTPKTEG